MDDTKATEGAQPNGVAAAAGAPATTAISCSRNFATWLSQHRVSLAFSSYQTGQLFLVGQLGDGNVSFHQRDFSRAMGLWHDDGQIYLASLAHIWRLANVLAPNEVANQFFDRLYVPRTGHVTGDIDVHEMAREASGRLIFVSTTYCCVATLSERYSFKPIWKPSFVSRLAAEDRCHLNGLCLEDGKLRYVTTVSRTDVVDGWRAHRAGGGCLIDVETDAIVADGFSMPHSPRLHQGRLYVLDSGRGYLVEIDRATGARRDIAFCPGFMRGLAFHNGHAIVTLSLPRNMSFAGLPIEDEIVRRGGEPWCGVHIINLQTGDVVEWIRLDGSIRELFDVIALPGVRCPMAAPLQGPDLSALVTLEP